MARPKAELTLTDDERQKLTTWAKRPKSAQRLALRARIVLACADQPSNKLVASQLGVCNATVGVWRRRFVAKRLDGLTDDPRPGAPRTVTDTHVEEVITKTLETKPAAATHWSTRTMAKTTGMSQSAISRIWRAFGLKPHLTETFKLSTDPNFVEKVRDVVGLYLSPPEKAIVLSVDEKSQVQALDRTQPILPMTPTQVERGTHDYVRHGTTSLFAALNVATGQVIGKCHTRHRHQEFMKFLDHVDGHAGERAGRNHPYRARQLRDAQDASGEALAAATSGVSLALHPDEQFVAQSDRAILCGDHGEADPSWCFPQRAVVGRGH
jgi:transposase